MTRLFAGTPFDRPPRCEACGELEEECTCPPPEHQWLAPEAQSTKVRVDKRKGGRMVTVVDGLKKDETDLPVLLKSLKDLCAAGGTIQGETLEIQGDHLAKVREHLVWIGYKIR